ncbi:MAG: adenylate/guanylate cyclase domain-containing protein [Acidimicrobiales bacterium]
MGEAVRTEYAKNGGVHLAYQVLGEAAVDLLMLEADFIPTDAWEEQPLLAHAIRRLASFSRLIRCDRRGIGCSDPITPADPPTLEQWMDDALTVLDAAGSECPSVMATNDAGVLAILLAATHPDRVRSLVLVNSYARGLSAPDYPWGWPEDVASKMADDTVEPSDDIGWGLDFVAPSMAGDEEFRRWWDRSGNRGASPATARALLDVYLRSDVRDILSVVAAPTLVVHRTGDASTSVENGRYLAEHIPGARLVELAGSDDFFWVGDADAVLNEIEEFLTGNRRPSARERVLATVLFTDIVESTARATQLGDARWRRLLDQHDRVCLQHIEQHRGQLVNTTGDGVLATFDGPARAIRCALGLRDALGALGLEIRAGLHTGEVDLRDHGVGGIAVHLAARVQAKAAPHEILVSRTVTDLVAGSGIDFADRGEHQLKGVAGTWRLFAVVD